MKIVTIILPSQSFLPLHISKWYKILSSMIKKRQIYIIFTEFIKCSTKSENVLVLLSEEKRADLKVIDQLVWRIQLLLIDSYLLSTPQKQNDSSGGAQQPLLPMATCLVHVRPAELRTGETWNHLQNISRLKLSSGGE